MIERALCSLSVRTQQASPPLKHRSQASAYLDLPHGGHAAADLQARAQDQVVRRARQHQVAVPVRRHACWSACAPAPAGWQQATRAHLPCTSR